MSATESTLRIKLLAEGQLQALTDAKKQSDALASSFDLARIALAGLGTGLSIAGAEALLEYGASLKHLSEQAGISTDAFQRLASVALDAGIHQQEFGSALNILQRNLAQAADGAMKQNRAITDLGLSTASLLAMPVEQQVIAIAQAYAGATDKGKAWADVTALLGRNSAQLKEVLNDLAQNGTGGEKIVSSADIERLTKAQDIIERIGTALKNAAAGGLADVMGAADKVNAFEVPWKKGEHAAMAAQKGAFHGTGTGAISDDNWDPAVKAAHVAAIQAELDATIQGLPQMVAAHQALAKALADEGKAFETSAEAAKRLRAEASSDEAQAAILGGNKGDATMQLAAVTLQASAAKLRTQANAEDAKAAKESATLTASELELKLKIAQAATALLPVNQQLSAASEHRLQIETSMAAIDVHSLTYRQDHLKLANEGLAVNKEIFALKEKDAIAYVEGLQKDHELATRREAIAIAVVEHDANLTDTQKWEEKRKILAQAVTEQEHYIQNMETLAGSSKVPQGARTKAGSAAGSGANDLAAAKAAVAEQGANPGNFAQSFSADLTKLKNQSKLTAASMAHDLTATVAGGFRSVETNLTGLITGSQTLSQTFRNIGQDIEQGIVSALVHAAVQMVENAVLGKALSASEKSDTKGSAGGLAVNAGLKSVGQLGPVYGTIAFIASLAAIMEATQGFESGGYTGGSEGQPVGTVHGQEFVWSAPAVRAVGVGNLERAHQAAIGGGGGASTGGGGGGNRTTHIIALSPADVAKAMRSHIGAIAQRAVGPIPTARFAM